MQLADLKRAVEDVLLQPELNDVTRADGRASIAALDLCHSTPSTSSASCASSSPGCPSVATRTCSSSSETVAAGTRGSSSVLATSTSLDHIMLRGTTGHRSGGISRRSSRILPPHHSSAASKRKRSNSLSSGYYKGHPPQPGLPPPSSLPPTARATPFRDSEYHPPHKLSLGSSESSTGDGAEFFLGPYVAPASQPDLGQGPTTIFCTSQGPATVGGLEGLAPLPATDELTNGFHEDEEMECD